MKKFLAIYLSAIIACFLFEYIKITKFETPAPTWNEPYPRVCPSHLDASKVPSTLAEYKKLRAKFPDLYGYPYIYIDTAQTPPEEIQKMEPFKTWGTDETLRRGEINYDKKGNLESFSPQELTQESPKAEFTCWYDRTGSLIETTVKTDISYLVYDKNNKLKLFRDIRR